MTNYGKISIEDLLLNGADGCTLYEMDEKCPTPFLIAVVDEQAMSGRGVAKLLYKGETIASEICLPPRGVDETGIFLGHYGISLGLLSNARRALKNTQEMNLF